MLGHVGELHPRWRQAYELAHAPIVFELELEAVLERPLPAFAPLPRQQAAWRGVALVVSESVRHDALVEALRCPMASSPSSVSTRALGVGGPK